MSDLYRGSITTVPGALDSELYVWGCAHQNSDWIVLNWRERRWRVIETISSENTPSARHAHSATYFTMLGEAYIAVLGGSARAVTEPNPPFSDVHIYDIKHRLWLPVPLASDSQANVENLTPRLFHSATFVEIEYDPYLVVVGGIFSDSTLAPNVPMPTMVNRRALVLPELRFYNLRLRCWSQPVYVPGRYRHSAILIPSTTREPKLMIIGGRDVRGDLSDETLLIDVRGAFRSLKHSSSAAERPPADNHGQGVYWSWLTGIVQPLGPYYGNCHVASHVDSVVIFALPNHTLTRPRRAERTRRANPFEPVVRSRPPEPSTSSSHSETQPGYSAWAISFDGGSTSFRELRKLRRISQKAEVAAQALATHMPNPVSPAPPTNPPVPAPPAAHPTSTTTPPKAEWLWCGTVPSGWGTAMGGQEDLLLLMYQTEGRVFLVPALLSALGIPRERSNEVDSTLSLGSSSGLLCLLPPLWDGTSEMSSVTLDPTVPPFGDFALCTSTPDAPPIILHRSVLLARSAHFRSLLTSGFSESRTGEVTVEENYAAAYALCHWIYTSSLPAWLESPNAFSWDDDFGTSLSTEGRYAAHAGEILCELLIAANARMLPTLANRVRQLIRAEHMHVPELAPLVWRAAELTDVSDVEELVPFSNASSRQAESLWVSEVVQTQMRPAEQQKQFSAAVSHWCCEGGPEVRAAMEGAKEWLEPEVWRCWVDKCAKLGGTETPRPQESFGSGMCGEKEGGKGGQGDVTMEGG